MIYSINLLPMAPPLLEISTLRTTIITLLREAEEIASVSLSLFFLTRYWSLVIFKHIITSFIIL